MDRGNFSYHKKIPGFICARIYGPSSGKFSNLPIRSGAIYTGLDSSFSG
jgi:hypothetical protein